jgi:hypothetical protein
LGNALQRHVTSKILISKKDLLARACRGSSEKSAGVVQWQVAHVTLRVVKPVCVDIVTFYDSNCLRNVQILPHVLMKSAARQHVQIVWMPVKMVNMKTVNMKKMVKASM